MNQSKITRQSWNDLRSHRILDRRNLETHTLICCNTPTYVDENYENLRSIIDFILLIDSIEVCLEKISNSDEYIFLIVSNQYVEELLSKTHHLCQLISVFVTEDTITTSVTQTKEYVKIQGIYNDFAQLQTDVKTAVNNFVKVEQAMPEVFDPTKIARSINTFRGDLWLIKLFYVLIRQQPPEDSKEYFFTLFSDYYKHNATKEQLLKNFIDTYEPSKAIWWYSKETFIYEVLNKALRENNIRIICAFHFFIRDLYTTIEYAHRSFNENGAPMFTYRGQKIHQMDIDRIQQAHDLDLRLSINSFLSTTLDRTVAVAFIAGFLPEGHLRGVIFEIECQANLTSRPFANVAEESNFGEEKEVLFTPGAAFAVKSIEFNETNQMGTIKLRLCNEQEILIGAHKKDMFKGDLATVRELFVSMEGSTLVRECTELKQLYNYTTKLFPSDELTEAEYLQAVGSKKFESQDFESSIDYYKRCLALKQKTLSSEHKEIAELNWWIGESYFRLNNYDQAIGFCRQAINAGSLSPVYARQPHFYLGCSYMQRDTDINWEDISVAKFHLQTALNISLEHGIADDSISRDIYRALAEINDQCEHDWESAIDHLRNALKICETNGWIDDYDQIKEEIETIRVKIETEEE